MNVQLTAPQSYARDLMADQNGTARKGMGINKRAVSGLVEKGIARWTVNTAKDWTAELVETPAADNKTTAAAGPEIDGKDWGAIQRAQRALMQHARAAGQNPTDTSFVTHNGLRSGNVIGFAYQTAEDTYGWILLDGSLHTTTGRCWTDAAFSCIAAYKNQALTARAA